MQAIPAASRKTPGGCAFVSLLERLSQTSFKMPAIAGSVAKISIETGIIRLQLRHGRRGCSRMFQRSRRLLAVLTLLHSLGYELHPRECHTHRRRRRSVSRLPLSLRTADVFRPGAPHPPLRPGVLAPRRLCRPGLLAGHRARVPNRAPLRAVRRRRRLDVAPHAARDLLYGSESVLRPRYVPALARVVQLHGRGLASGRRRAATGGG